MSTVAVEAPVDVGALLRRLRFPVVIIIIAAALVTLLAIVGRESHTAVLDPRNTSPSGAHALSVLLAERGIPVTIAAATSQLATSATTTIMVSTPDQQSVRALHAIAHSPATVVLIDPTVATLHAVGITAAPDAATSAATIEPLCSLPAAVTAGSALISGDLYLTAPTATRCYLQQGDAALFETSRSNGANTIVFGSPSTFSNAQLADSGDAALALGLLDGDAVQWVTAPLDAGPAAGSRRGLFHLLPSRLLWAALQLLIVLVITALWRVRRLGPVVVEPLPVVVRAAETVEGRGRLMRAAHSRGLAARSLRAATIGRISRALGIGTGDGPASIVGVIAERTATSPAEIEAVLYGDDPSDDDALVRLAQRLPTLETAVRQDNPPPTPPSGATS